MTKQVTATFTVQLRAVWSVSPTDPCVVWDDENVHVATFAKASDASSAVSDHNRAGRARAKARERAKVAA